MHISFKALLCFATALPIVVALPHNNERSANPRADLGQEMVLTPLGWRPKSSLVHVPADAQLHHREEGGIDVVHNNGTILHHAPRSLSSSAFASGFVAYAHYSAPTSTPIKSFSATWKVPPNPSTNHGQTLFLFIGLEPNTYDAILQPVLQWGSSAAGGGAFWQVSSWYVSSNSANTYHTALVNVTVGQSLTGVMSIDAPNHKYSSSFTGISLSSLTINNGPQLVWATETLEAYKIQAKSDYPTGTTTFSNINLVGPSSVSWNAVSDTADGITTTIVKNGGVNAQVDIRYT